MGILNCQIICFERVGGPTVDLGIGFTLLSHGPMSLDTKYDQDWML